MRFGWRTSEVAEAKLPDCIRVFPICPDGTVWEPDSVKALIDGICERHKVDLNRIYLTGYSMGGRGTWDTALEYPDTFAAVLPLCGFSCYLRAKRMKNVPAWAIHGDKDFVVPVEESKKMISALKWEGCPDARLTVIENEGHGVSWVYRHEQVWDWLFSKTKEKGKNDKHPKLAGKS